MRRSYTVKEKLDALSKLRENNGNISLTARNFIISNKMLRDWRNRQDTLVEVKRKIAVRKVGSGCKPAWPALESELKQWVVDARTKNKKIITYSVLREKALAIALNLGIQDFSCSNFWLGRFIARNGFSCRKITSIGQENNRDPAVIKSNVLHYLETLSFKANILQENEEIYNMDETPVYIDMMQTRTISFKGEKNTEANSSGNQKTRLTVALAINSAGKMLKAMVILKGLKKSAKMFYTKQYLCNGF